jgi:hypothetical protein
VAEVFAGGVNDADVEVVDEHGLFRYEHGDVDVPRAPTTTPGRSSTPAGCGAA